MGKTCYKKRFRDGTLRFGVYLGRTQNGTPYAGIKRSDAQDASDLWDLLVVDGTPALGLEIASQADGSVEVTIVRVDRDTLLGEFFAGQPERSQPGNSV